MKRVFIGAIVGTMIYFAFQTLMWMGGFNKDFYTYTANQDTIMTTLSRNLTADGLYMMPMADPKSPGYKSRQAEIEKKMPGNPWAMVFYHPKMDEASAPVMIFGLVYTLLAVLIVAMVLHFGKFPGFWSRFLVSMAFAAFALLEGSLASMNWWSFPWSFVKTQVTDLTLGWGLCSAWLSWYLRR